MKKYRVYFLNRKKPTIVRAYNKYEAYRNALAIEYGVITEVVRK